MSDQLMHMEEKTLPWVDFFTFLFRLVEGKLRRTIGLQTNERTVMEYSESMPEWRVQFYVARKEYRMACLARQWVTENDCKSFHERTGDGIDREEVQAFLATVPARFIPGLRKHYDQTCRWERERLAELRLNLPNANSKTIEAISSGDLVWLVQRVYSGYREDIQRLFYTPFIGYPWPLIVNVTAALPQVVVTEDYILAYETKQRGQTQVEILMNNLCHRGFLKPTQHIVLR